MRECLYYNLPAGSFHTKKLCSRLYSIEFDFCSIKRKNRFFEPPFLDLRVTHTHYHTFTILTCAQKRTSSQLSLPHGTANLKINEMRTKKKTVEQNKTETARNP